MQIKGAIFDMDGTLIDSLMLWDVLWREFGKLFCGGEIFRPSQTDEKAVRTLPLKDAMELLNRNYNIVKSGEELLSIANSICLEFYKNEVLMKEGARDFLDFCLKNNIKMCVASATAIDLLETAIKHCKLEKYFEKVLSCATKGIGKEKPDIFFEALDVLGTDINDTYIFEDSIVALKTAKKAGFKTVGIFDKYNLPYQNEIEKTATYYISKEKTLKDLI